MSRALKSKGTRQFDVEINATLEVEEYVWEELLELYEDEDDPAEAAKYDLAQDLEGSNLDTINGSAWVCSVEVNGEI